MVVLFVVVRLVVRVGGAGATVVVGLEVVVVAVVLFVEDVGIIVGIGLFFSGGKYVTRSIVEGLGGLVGLVGR